MLPQQHLLYCVQSIKCIPQKSYHFSCGEFAGQSLNTSAATSLGFVNTHMIKKHRSELPQKVQEALLAEESFGAGGDDAGGGGLYQCSHCNQSFNSGTDINAHLTQDHSVVKDFALHYK